MNNAKTPNPRRDIRSAETSAKPANKPIDAQTASSANKKTPTVNPDTSVDHNQKPECVPRDFTLSRDEARAGSPADASVTGEEDPGAGLEFLVKKEKF